MDNAGNSVNLVFSIICLPSGWDSLSVFETDDGFYLSCAGQKIIEVGKTECYMI